LKTRVVDLERRVAQLEQAIVQLASDLAKRIDLLVAANQQLKDRWQT